MLLAGYVYAHLLMKFAPLRTALVIHLLVMVVACAALPLHIATGWVRPPAEDESLWLIGLFTVSIGLPFFALSANSPLLQAWFARTDHQSAKDPYFLYVASNIGSFLALIAYPFVIEPFVGLGAQTSLWTAGFYGLIVLIGGCAALSSQSNSLPRTIAAPETEAARPGWRDVASCVGLSAVPSGLLLAVTSYMSTDVASVPLFWVMPLALYLLSLVIAFQTNPVIPHWLVLRAFPVCIVVLTAFVALNPVQWLISSLTVHVVAFFVTALMCHGELARRRPAARYLTNFYIWLSAGGLIGGVTTGLVAPHLFTWIAEYPILIVSAILCVPSVAGSAIKTLNRQGRAARGDRGPCYGPAGAVRPERPRYQVQRDVGRVSSAGCCSAPRSYCWRKPAVFAAIVGFIFVANAYCFTYDRGKSRRPQFLRRAECR